MDVIKPLDSRIHIQLGNSENGNELIVAGRKLLIINLGFKTNYKLDFHRR